MDISIFEQTREELLTTLLQNYESVSRDTHGNEFTLFIVDKKMCNMLNEAQKLLEMEYGHDNLIYKKYSLENIVKYISPSEPVYTYSLYEKTYHRHINDQEKVFEKLETEFALWKKRHKKNVLKKLKAEKATKEMLDNKSIELEAEIAQAEITHQYILDNFEKMEVRISSLAHRPSYGIVIRYKVPSSKADKTQRLKSSIANVIYFEKFEAPQENNKIIHFLNKATNAYGDVYFFEDE